MFLLVLNILVFNLIDNYVVKKLDSDTSSKVISVIHSIITSIMASLYLTNVCDMSLIPYTTTISISFALYDSYSMYIRNHKNMYIFIFHHLIVISGNAYFMYYNTLDLYRIYYIIYLCEYPGLFLNTSLHIINNKLPYPNILYFSNIMCIITFFLFRIVNYINLVYLVIDKPLLLSGIIPLSLMNIIWFYKIIEGHQSIDFKNYVYP